MMSKKIKAAVMLFMLPLMCAAKITTGYPVVISQVYTDLKNSSIKISFNYSCCEDPYMDTKSITHGTLSSRDHITAMYIYPPTAQKNLINISIRANEYKLCSLQYNALTNSKTWIYHHHYQPDKKYPPITCSFHRYPENIFLGIID